MKRQQKKQGKKVVNEHQLTMDERVLFQNAKAKEFKSFFENEVWIFDTAATAGPHRTLTARMLLSWSKNADGSPRAKARLIARGFADVDAPRHLGNLEPNDYKVVSQCAAVPLNGVPSRTTSREETVGEASGRCVDAAWS